MAPSTEKNGYKVIKKNETEEADFTLDYKYNCSIIDFELFCDFIKNKLKMKENMNIVPRLKYNDKQILSFDFDFYPKGQRVEDRKDLLKNTSTDDFVLKVIDIVDDLYNDTDLDNIVEKNSNNGNIHLYFNNVFLNKKDITTIRTIIINKMENDLDYFDNSKSDTIDLLNGGNTLLRLPFFNKMEKNTFINDTSYLPYNIKKSKFTKFSLSKAITHIENVFCNSFNTNFEEFGEESYELKEEYVTLHKNIKDKQNEVNISNYNNSVIDIDATKDKLEQLLLGFETNYFGCNTQWHKLVTILTNENCSLEFIIEYLKTNIPDYKDDYDFENEKIYKKVKSSTSNNKLTIKTLYGMLKEHNPSYFNELIKLNVGEMKEFSQDYFNNIPLNGDDNYDMKKKYFEEHYKYFKDVDAFMRIRYKYNKTSDYYNKDLVDIKASGLKTDLYQVKLEDGTIKNERFIDRYMLDTSRCNFLNVEFNPSCNNNKYYNLFTGFNYIDICKEEDITDEDKANFDILLNFMKKYHYEDREDLFDYGISVWANIIQNPDFLPHIIPIYYSKEHGTGKSNDLKLKTKSIGRQYSYFGTIEDVTRTHTTAHLGKFVNVLEEPVFTPAFIEDLKRLSQQTTAVYNGKCKLEISVDTFVRYMIAGNHIKNFRIPKEDRRFIVFNFRKCMDDELVDLIDNLMDDKKMIYLFGKYLENYEIKFQSRREWIKNRPLTETYYNMVVKESVPSFIECIINEDDYFQDSLYLNHTLSFYKTDNNMSIPIDYLYGFYKEYCEECNNTPFKKDNFKKQIKSIFPDLKQERLYKTGSRNTYFSFNLNNYET